MAAKGQCFILVCIYLEERQFVWLTLDDMGDNQIVQVALHGQVVQIPLEAAGHTS